MRDIFLKIYIVKLYFSNHISSILFVLSQINKLVKSYYGEINQSIVFRVNLQGIVSDIMWSLWSYVQAEKSVLDFDYNAHGTYRLERAINKIESKEYELWKNNI